MAFEQVANQQLANVATATFKGRASAGTGSPEDLTVAQALALLGLSPTPTQIDSGEVYTVAEGTQIVWADGITVAGSLVINGSLRGVR